jgi:glycosyltransferase involved in cell wall biosynthesis
MNANNYSYEIIFVDDGSTDNSWNIIEELRNKNPNIKGIKFQRNYGKSAGLNEGFRAAQGDVVITMDADLQDSPDEIPELRRMVIEDGFDLVSGWKKKRYDNALTKNIPSKFYNATTRWMSGIKLHDFNCGLKSYRKNVVKSIEVYGEMHRYTPVLAKWAGFKKIGEKVVTHQARKYGVSKFGISRFVNGPLDLASIMFVGKYGKRPMHFFGLLGSVFFMVGIVLSFYLVIKKFLDPESTLTDKPGFYIALTTTIIGVQLFLSGFIGELISRNAPGRNSYLIEKKVGV